MHTLSRVDSGVHPTVRNGHRQARAPSVFATAVGERKRRISPLTAVHRRAGMPAVPTCPNPDINGAP
jgi:hypothetical protein